MRGLLLLLFACGSRRLSTLGFAIERYTSSGGEVAFLNFHLVRGLLLLLSACGCRVLSTLGFAVVERLLSWIFIFFIFFLDSLRGFLFLFTDTLCISRGITILLKATDFPNNFDAKITLRIPRRSYDLCMLIPMCLKQNKTVNHSKINEMVLNVERICCDLSTAFIFML